MADAIGYVAFVLTVIGNLLLIHKNNNGWIVRFVCTVLWLIYAINIVSYPLIANSTLYLGLNFYGWHKWKKEAKK